MKAKLRRKNRLVRPGRLQEASTLAHRTCRDIERHCRSRVSKLHGKVDVEEAWAAVRQLTGSVRHQAVVDGVDAVSV